MGRGLGWTVMALLAVLLAQALLPAVPAAAQAEGTSPLEAGLERFRTTVANATATYEAAYQRYQAAGNESQRQAAVEEMVAAGQAVGQAFLAFERGHGQEASLSTFMQTQMENRFYRAFERNVILLRATMLQADDGSPAPPSEVQTYAVPVQHAFERTATCLPEGCGGSLVGAGVQAFLVLLREGFEAVLLVGAMVAYLHKSDRGEKARHVYGGVAAALVATLVAWFALERLLGAAATTVSQRVIEGATMLLAAGILFYVGFWLLGKVEARRWQAFLDGRVQDSLAQDRTLLLGSLGFLAVFREGLETVLFVKALSFQAPGGTGEIALGLLAGAVAVGLLYYAIHAAGIHLPLRPFFAATSAILLFLSLRFLGLGLFELQEAGVLAVTPLPGVAGFLAAHPLQGLLAQDVLGFAPTAEVLLGQGLLVGLVAVAAAWTWARPSLGEPSKA